MQKQLMILEDPAVPKSLFEQLVAAAQLPYRVVWVDEETEPELVEVLVTVKKPVDQTVIEKFTNLKMIAVAFTGFDSIDMAACRQAGVAVYNVPDYSTNSVAELTVGLAVSLLRQIPAGNQAMRNGHWNVPAGFDLAGKKVGIVGTGRIGMKTAAIFRAMDCQLLGWSRSKKQEFIELGGSYADELIDLFAQADIITLHVPYNSFTKNLVGEKELSVMKPAAYLINTSRGPVLDEAAIIGALRQRRIAGAALDVFVEEPINPDNELLKLDNVVLTPHIAFKTHEALIRRAEITVNNVAAYLRGDVTNRQ